jgi:hypothetical protein
MIDMARLIDERGLDATRAGHRPTYAAGRVAIADLYFFLRRPI